MAQAVLVAFTMFLAAAFPQTATDPYDAVNEAMRQQDFAKALRLLEPALQQEPKNAQLWTMQGVALAGEGHNKEALNSFQRALKISPDSLPALHGAAQIEYDAGSAEGIPILQHVLRLRPNEQTSHGMLAILEYQQGNYAAAASQFEKSGALFDSRVEGLHAYAACLLKSKQFDKAAVVLQKSLALSPEDRPERRLLASLQLISHQPQKALVTLAPLLEVNPDSSTLDLASAAYEDTTDTDRAVSTLRQAILLDPNNVSLYLDFANVASAHQSYQVGIDIVNDGLNLLPKAAPLYFARGVLYTMSGQYDKGDADFQTAYELDPSQSLTAAAQGLAVVETGDLAHALATVQKKLEHTPNDPVLLYVQADILTQQGAEPGSPEFQLALRSVKKAVAMQPKLAPARGVLVKLDLKDGQYADAAEECRKVLALDPNNLTAVYHLIQALRKMGNNDEIPELLKRLAVIREQTFKEERDRYLVKVVEDASPK